VLALGGKVSSVLVQALTPLVKSISRLDRFPLVSMHAVIKMDVTFQRLLIEKTDVADSVCTDV